LPGRPVPTLHFFHAWFSTERFRRAD
jgi:hypothetical protein